MIEKLDLGEKVVCNIVGKMFAFASEKLSCYEISFCKAWLTSRPCERIAEMDETLIGQSKVYLFNDFIKELNIPFYEGYKINQDVMYWAGYIFTYWMFATGITGKEIAERYDIKSILQQYDVLHTQSTKHAIETIQKEFSKAEVLKNSILHS